MDSAESKQLQASKAKKIEGTGGAVHQYSEEEVAGFANLINSYLKDDPLCKSKLPINPEGEDLFEKVGDGWILSKLIEKAQPGTIDIRALNTKDKLNIFQIKENLNLVINSAKSIGCKIVSIFPESFIEKRPHLILGMLWQVLRMCLLSQITLKDNPYLARLLEPDETLEHFKNQPPEDILLRWFNFHLKNANHDRRVHNFSEDVKDGINYTILLNQLNPDLCDKSGLADNEETRAQKAIDNAEKLGVERCITAKDINSANPRLNLLFTSLIYNACHGLEPKTQEEKEQYEAAKLLEEKADPNDTREERSFRMWCNSLDVTDPAGNPYFFNNLYDDLADGIMMLKLLEKIGAPVEWKKVNIPATNKFKALENCNYAVDLGKKMNFTLVGIGGSDIYDKKKKLVLGCMWQMVRKHVLDTIGGISEEQLIKWANSRVTDVEPIKNFSDPSLKNGKYLFAVLKSIEPRAINWEYVTPGETEEEVEGNAKYAISVARRLGATVYCVWEDIRDVKPKMILTFIAALKKVAEQPKETGSQDVKENPTTEQPTEQPAEN